MPAPVNQPTTAPPALPGPRRPRVRARAKTAALALLLLAAAAMFSGCFKDKGGMGGNSVLNLTPQQQLHAIAQAINDSKALVDENEVKRQIQTLERLLKEASGETKYKAIYYLTWVRAFYAELLARRGTRDVRAGLDLLRFAQKDLDHFRKAGYKPDEYRFLTGMVQSARLEFEPSLERRVEAWRTARASLAAILKKREDFETEFRIADVAFRKPDVMLALARLHRRFDDPFRAWRALDDLARKYPVYSKSPLAKIERAYLHAQLGDHERAASHLAEFKGRAYSGDLFREEGLWLLSGIYAILAKDEPKWALDEKTVKAMLKDSGSFFAKGAGPLERYLPVRERAYIAYGKALALFFDGRAAEALEICRDLVDDGDARRNEFARLEAQTSTLQLAHYLAARCLEETRNAGPDEIRLHDEAAAHYADTAEISLEQIAAVEQAGSQGTLEATLDLKSLLVGTTEAETAGTPPAELPPPPKPPGLPMPVPPRPGM